MSLKLHGYSHSSIYTTHHYEDAKIQNTKFCRQKNNVCILFLKGRRRFVENPRAVSWGTTATGVVAGAHVARVGDVRPPGRRGPGAAGWWSHGVRDPAILGEVGVS